ncbi:Uncharacterised protein [Mycobacteroides abscessus subsp. abscessus]|nr:Uncharacterised protein [Mycobacteroides abscessus subsp. abscessus]SKV50275.1 Uncharacterised protein [Mycobacteroides abscessus subsp. abscessus]
MSAAVGPALRRTVHHSKATAATPMTACGTSIDHGLKPNSRTLSSISHRNSGGLSTVMELAASDEPKTNAFHDTDPACTAAA